MAWDGCVPLVRGLQNLARPQLSDFAEAVGISYSGLMRRANENAVEVCIMLVT